MPSIGRILSDNSSASVLYSREVIPGLHSFQDGVFEFRIGESGAPVLKESLTRRALTESEDTIFAVHRSGYPLRVGFLDAFALDLSCESPKNKMLNQLKSLACSLAPVDMVEGEFHLVTYQCPELLGALVMQLEVLGVKSDRIYAHSTHPVITISAIDGSFSYGNHPNESYFPIRNVGAAIDTFHRADVLDLARAYWSNYGPEMGLSKSEIEDIALQQWSQGLEGKIPIRTLFTNDPAFLDFYSVADKREHLRILECIYAQVEGKRNVAGHDVVIDGAIYVTLNAPMHGDSDKIIHGIEIPKTNLLGWCESGSPRRGNRPYTLEDDLSEPYCVTLRSYFNSHAP